MYFLRQNRTWLFALLIAVFFIFAQSANIAHATIHGTAHNHDNKICIFSAVSDEDEDDLALPPDTPQSNVPILAYTYISIPTDSLWTHRSVAATARAPPVLFLV